MERVFGEQDTVNGYAKGDSVKCAFGEAWRVKLYAPLGHTGTTSSARHFLTFSLSV